MIFLHLNTKNNLKISKYYPLVDPMSVVLFICAYTYILMSIGQILQKCFSVEVIYGKTDYYNSHEPLSQVN